MLFGNTQTARQDLTRQAVQAYSQALVHGGVTPPAARTATTVAQTLLKDTLLGEHWLKLLRPEGQVGEAPVGVVSLTFDAVMPTLTLPAPVISRQPGPWSRALAAFIGAILGLLILTPIARLALDMRDVGLFLGGPLGAMVGVLIAGRWGRLWHWLRAKPATTPLFDVKAHESIVQTLIDQWLQLAVLMLSLLWDDQALLAADNPDQAQAFKRLSRQIYALFSARAEQLPVAADELIQEARNCGFTGLDGSPVFLAESLSDRTEMVWKQSMISHYEPFGHITEGDRVWIERKPVLLQDQVVERGLVRKVRS